MTSRKIRVSDKKAVKQPRHELLQVAEAVAREKGIEVSEALTAMEFAIQKAAKAKYGFDHNIRASIDDTTGEISIFRIITVVEEVENEASEISLEDARIDHPDVELDYEFVEELPPLEFGRGAAQSARQTIVQKIREAEREHQYSEFLDRKGEIVSGIVKQVDYNQVIVDIGKTEGVLRKEENIPRQTFRVGDRIKAILIDIKPESSGPMLILSRTSSQFIVKLFEQEVTEVYDGIIKIMSVARDPGSRSKMSVYSPDNRVDPVGSCVGVRGSRVQSIMNELQGEKIDILPWSSDQATYIMSALSLQEARRVVIDEEAGKVDVIVDDEHLSQAIGRRGQNVRLASMLTNWKISVVSESEDSAKRLLENSAKVKSLVDNLKVDEIMAQLLISEGFASIEDIAQSDLEDFASIEGFDEETSKELRQRAIDFIDAQEEKFFKMCEELGISDDLLTLEGLDIPMFIKLIDAGIRTRDDIADLSNDELIDIVGIENLSNDEANEIIMSARESWFNDEPEETV